MKRIYGLCADKRLLVYSAGAVIRSLLTVAIPFLLGLFIDSLIYGGRGRLLFSVLAGTALLVWILELWLKDFIIRIARTKEQQLQNRLLDSFRRMRPAAVDAFANGEIAMKFFRDTGTVEQFIANFYPQILNMFSGFLFATVMVLYKKPLIAALCLFVLPAMFVCLWNYAKRLTVTAHAIRSMYDRSANGIFEFMHVFPYLKSMASDEPYFASPRSKFSTFRKVNTINDKTVMMLDFIARFLLLAGEYSVLGIAGWMAWKKIIPVGDVVVFQVLFLSVFHSFSGIFQLLPSWKATQESAASIYELLDSNGTEDVEQGEPIPSALSDVSVKHVSFRYPGSGKPVFSDFSCEIKGGSVVALTGENGSGKTTLLKLLTGYLLPDSGTVEIMGKPLSGWQINSFRRKIACVFQDSLLISGTVRDNVTLKNTEYSEEDIERALQLSGADQLVRRIPDGLNHKVGISGDGLSGGERQKIAIARALIREPEILIFDEVTNHLDYQSRMNIRDLIAGMRGKTTVFMVSHDPELIKLCDQEIKL